MNFYQALPAPPTETKASTVLTRLIDGIGFRYRIATEGLTDKEFTFRPVEGSMNMEELLRHIYQLMAWSYRSFFPESKQLKQPSGLEGYRQATLLVCHEFSAAMSTISDEELEKVSVYLKRINTHFSFWYMINGPLADALTHIGQINSWRRIAGNPVPRISPFTGEDFS